MVQLQKIALAVLYAVRVQFSKSARTHLQWVA
jgi:hypothetical protein